MNAALPSDPELESYLRELAAIGMQAARDVGRLIAIEREAAEAVVGWLPSEPAGAGSLDEAVAAGQGVDAVAEAMEQAVPRVEVLARALDRVSRGVRRDVALLRRMQAGWPRGAADDRLAMVRRQVARSVGDAIAQEQDGEAAERLFDDLAERLDDPATLAELDALPVDQAVRRVCRDLGLAAATLKPLGVKGTTVPSRGLGQRPDLSSLLPTAPQPWPATLPDEDLPDTG